MSKLVVNGGKTLQGEVKIGGAKNSTVAIIPASILSETKVVLDNVPKIQDVYNLIDILEGMNVKTEFHDDVLEIDPTNIEFRALPDGKIKSLRASYYFMGAMLGRFGKAEVGLPGGDDIGPRPIDQHVKGFKALGAEVSNENGSVVISTNESGLHGTRIFLDMVSVGATINVILAAVKAEGVTTIENAAKEPEIIDVVTFLNNMGAQIRGAGTETIRITGVKHLRSKNVHTIISDRIEVGTYMSLAAVAGDGINITNVIPEHLDAFLAKMDEIGVDFDVKEDSIYVRKSDDLHGVQVKTMPYPGFATDLQQPITPVLLKAEGESMVVDTIYPKRVKHISELNKMDADITSENNVIICRHSTPLQPANVTAEEIRAGACLLIAALMTEGKTVIEKAENIFRGYDRIIDKLTNIGADVSYED